MTDGTTDGASLTVTASYIALNGGNAFLNDPGISFGSGSTTPPGDATLTLNASNQIDLAGSLTFQNIGRATFNSLGDIRLLPAQSISRAQLEGLVASDGNLSFNAAAIYPVTNTLFAIELLSAGGTVSFGYPAGGGPSTITPLSADGGVLVSADTIVQDGEILAPFGSIILGTQGTQTVTLGAGSVTSVSANGTVIPFGTTVDQTTWIYNPATANPTWNGATAANLAYADPLTQAPQGIVTLDGAAVQFNSGATVNVAGGGDLQAQEWIPGTGGSRNVLAQYNTGFQNSTVGQQVPLYPDARQSMPLIRISAARSRPMIRHLARPEQPWGNRFIWQAAAASRPALTRCCRRNMRHFPAPIVSSSIPASPIRSPTRP